MNLVDRRVHITRLMERVDDQAGIETEHPLAVTFFTNEEGARFAPDMMGNLVFVGGMDLDAAHEMVGTDGRRVGSA